jgi:hypothetical protein
MPQQGTQRVQKPYRASSWLTRGTTSTVVLALLLLGASSPAVAALTTESPEVKAAVAKGIAFLEKSSDERPGAKAVAGLVLVKDGRDANHPKIQEAVAAIKAAIAKPPITIDVYSVGLSIIFLVELDPSRYRAEIDALIKHLLAIQQPWGSWGYEGSSTGDTSESGDIRATTRATINWSSSLRRVRAWAQPGWAASISALTSLGWRPRRARRPTATCHRPCGRCTRARSGPVPPKWTHNCWRRPALAATSGWGPITQSKWRPLSITIFTLLSGIRAFERS